MNLGSLKCKYNNAGNVKRIMPDVFCGFLLRGLHPCIAKY
jgi:hypothetical protein